MIFIFTIATLWALFFLVILLILLLKQPSERSVSSIFVHTIVFLGITGIFFTVSFFAIIVAVFSANQIVLITGFALSILGVPLLAYSLAVVHKHKRLKIWLWTAWLGIVTLPNIAQALWTYYDAQFPRISDVAVELDAYKPFKQGNKLAGLKEPSLLTFNENLPKLDGARALYPVYAAFAQAVYPEGQYDFNSEVGFHNTIDAYKALQNRTVDMIFVASPSKEQIKSAEAKNVHMVLTPIGKEAFVFFVNSRNPVNSLSVEQIRSIYTGDITWWNQVGGKFQKIYPFQRNSGSGSQTAFLKFMGSTRPMSPPTHQVAGGMGGIINRIADYANYAGAIGFSFRYFSQVQIQNSEIKLLAINGVHPTFETIKAGTYPLTADFYAVTLEDNTNPNVTAFLNWILSEQGQTLIEKTGYASIR